MGNHHTERPPDPVLYGGRPSGGFVNSAVRQPPSHDTPEPPAKKIKCQHSSPDTPSVSIQIVHEGTEVKSIRVLPLDHMKPGFRPLAPAPARNSPATPDVPPPGYTVINTMSNKNKNTKTPKGGKTIKQPERKMLSHLLSQPLPISQTTPLLQK